MIGKFTEWLLENTDLLLESDPMFAGAHEYKRVVSGNTSEIISVLGPMSDIDPEIVGAVVDYIMNKGLAGEISSIGLSNDKKGLLNHKAPIIFYITTENQYDSSYRLDLSLKLQKMDKPIKLVGDYYLWNCNPGSEHETSIPVFDSNTPDVGAETRFETNSNKGTPSKSRFYLGIYKKNKIIDEKTNKKIICLSLIKTILYKIENDKASANSTNKPRTAIHDANMILTKIFGNTNEGVISAAGKNGISISEFINRFNTVMEQFNENRIIDQVEYDFWFKLFNIKIKGSKINTSELYKNVTIGDNIPLMEYMSKSNYGVIASEILIPFFLVNNVKVINGVNLLEKITNEKNQNVAKIIWPLKQNEKYIDYSISFIENNEGKRYGISAKGAEKSHKPSLITMLSDIDLNSFDLSQFKKGTKTVLNNFVKLISEPVPTRALTVWYLGAYIINGGKFDKNVLKNFFKYLYKNNTLDCTKSAASKKLGSKFNANFPGINDIIQNNAQKCMANTKYERCYPYSLTSYFENAVNTYINENLDLKKCIEYIRFSDPIHNYAQVKLSPNKVDGFKISVLPPSSKGHNLTGNLKCKIGSSNGADENRAIKRNDLSNIEMIKLVCLKSKNGQFILCDFDSCT